LRRAGSAVQDGQDHGQDRRDQHPPILNGGVTDVKRLGVGAAHQRAAVDGFDRMAKCCDDIE